MLMWIWGGSGILLVCIFAIFNSNGEFSMVRRAPGDSGYKYLRDVTDLFEQYKWDWSYHAYREWDGWSLEHGPEKNNRKPTATPTKRMQVLLGWFAGNR